MSEEEELDDTAMVDLGDDADFADDDLDLDLGLDDDLIVDEEIEGEFSTNEIE